MTARVGAFGGAGGAVAAVREDRDRPPPRRDAHFALENDGWNCTFECEARVSAPGGARRGLRPTRGAPPGAREGSPAARRQRRGRPTCGSQRSAGPSTCARSMAHTVHWAGTLRRSRCGPRRTPKSIRTTICSPPGCRSAPPSKTAAPSPIPRAVVTSPPRRTTTGARLR